MYEMPSAFAYSPKNWQLTCLDCAVHLKASGGYARHFVETVLFSLQLVVAGVVGYTHAFLPSMVPFVAEEVGAELCTIPEHLQSARRSAKKKATSVGRPYAFSFRRWIWKIDGKAHVR